MASERYDDGVGTKGRRITRTITDALYRMHQARQRLIESMQVRNGDPDPNGHHEMQAAVLETYHSLRPLRDENAVEDMWDDVTLWEEFEGYAPATDDDGQTITDKNGDTVVTEVYSAVEGFDSLERKAAEPQVETKEVTDAFGTRTITEESVSLLDPRILVKVSQKLDDAAKKLGFAPDVDEHKGQAKIDDRLMDEFEEWKEANQ